MRAITTRTDGFDRALAQVKAVTVRPEFDLAEAPGPQRLAPSSLALTIERSDLDAVEASGRFVLLHDPDGVEEWGGCFRAVVFVRAELESDLIDEPMLYDVGWSWVEESLAGTGARVAQLGGTVTRNAGRSFGTMADRPSDGYVEIRASWTPLEDAETGDVLDDLGLHVTAWVDLTAHAAGLPPVPLGVTHVDSARRRHRR
ncbi:MAG: hypothetical protein QG661_254 [Actinomycetota bacterium]|jgi:hypothetical protein|nr:hypothetical protein [Actinomycetota bacterium]